MKLEDIEKTYQAISQETFQPIIIFQMKDKSEYHLYLEVKGNEWKPIDDSQKEVLELYYQFEEAQKEKEIERLCRLICEVEEVDPDKETVGLGQIMPKGQKYKLWEARRRVAEKITRS